MSSDSSVQDTSQLASQAHTPRASVEEGGVTFWLDGEVLACACPDCGSPMSIRLWLLVADCWRCGASLELTEEQERAVQRLLDQARQAAPAPEKKHPATQPTPPSPRPEPPRQKKPAPQPVPIPEGKPLPRRQQSPWKDPVVRPRPARPSAPRRPQRQEDSTARLRRLLGDLQAWLISALLHMVLLILLACLLVNEEPAGPRLLVLATRVGPEDLEGGHKDPPQPDPVEFEDAGAPEPEKPPEVPEPPQIEEEKPDEPPLPKGEPPGEKEPELPPVVGSPVSGGTGRSLYAGRRPEARAYLVRQEGGTIETEAAVARGLEWLARHQSPDGRWSLHRFHLTRGCRRRCSHPGTNSDVAGTALGLLPFLGAGQTHRSGKYRRHVLRGVQWLLAHQRPDGAFRPMGTGQMYSHGLAAIAVCELYGLTQDSRLRLPAQKAVDYIVQAQHSQGGWRYLPGQAGDTSVTGWQLMALRSAQVAGLRVPQSVFDRANRFLDRCQTNSLGSLYSYMPHGGVRVALTAESLLCRMYSGWTPRHAALREGCLWLLAEHPPQARKTDMYYWYYATQVMHHMGSPYWPEWNEQMREILVRTQETRGHAAGSWTPQGGHDRAGGRLYMTSLAICCLEVYYRHLPLYRQVALGSETDRQGESSP